METGYTALNEHAADKRSVNYEIIYNPFCYVADKHTCISILTHKHFFLSVTLARGAVRVSLVD